MTTVTAVAHKTIGKLFSNEIGYVKLTYNFATDGGEADDAIKLATVDDDILVMNAVVEVATTCTSGGSATVKVGAASADDDGFMSVSTGAVASLAAGFTAKETAGQKLNISATDTIVLDIATADLTAGKIFVHLWYVNGA